MVTETNKSPNDSDGVHQEARWVGFYEAAWAARARFLGDLIAAGERYPERLIGRLNATERKYVLQYDQGDGQAAFNKVALPSPATPAGTPLTRQSSYRGQFLEVPYYADTPLHNYIIDYCDEHGPFDALVELGCGYGRNLFEIYYQGGPKIPYFGGELSDSGVGLARQIAALEPKQTFSFFSFDHLKPNLKPLPVFGKILVFTMHTIEQVNRIGVELFKTIAQAASSVTCLHFEPFGFQVKELGEATRYQKKGFEKFGWNENFYTTLLAAADQGILKVDHLDTELFLAQDRFNPTSLAIWHAALK